jgi:hypothetical protein
LGRADAVGVTLALIVANIWIAAFAIGIVSFAMATLGVLIGRAVGAYLGRAEGFFSNFARSVLRHIRVASKQELKDRILAAMDHLNHNPVVHTWSYKLKKAA